MEIAYNTAYKKRTWYNSERFPLIPIIKTKKSDEYNASSFSFRWLFFTMWTLSTPSFEIAIVLSHHWGFGLIGLFAYFRWAITIPCPMSLDRFIYKYLNRDPKILNHD